MGRLTKKWLQLSGITLLLIGVVGFMLVADDLRHVGESAAVASITVSGLALIGASRGMLAHFGNLAWLPVGLFIGMIGGVAIDAAGWGFVAGLIIGIVLMRLKHGKANANRVVK